jgi:hypothetical protein
MNNTSQEKNKQKKRIARGRWAQIPMQVWKECSHSQLCVYGALSLLQGTNDYTWASVEVIGEHAGYSKSTTDRTIRELIKLGWIGRIKQFGRPSKVFVYMDCIENDKIRLNMIEGKKQANKEFSEKMKEKKKVKKLIDTPNLSNNDNSNLSVSVLLNLSESDTSNLSESIYNNQFTNNNYNKHVREESPIPDRVFGKTEQPHTQGINFLDPKIQELAQAFGISTQDLDLTEEIQDEINKIAIPKKTEQEINTHYSNEIAKVEQEYNLQRDINIPKLSIGSLLEASEEFLRRIGIGFDNNPRRILNLIYNQMPKDFVIKEDSKDVEILGDMIKKYMASRQDERESIAKRIYQSVEAMLKIYVIKKYGEPYREVLYPEILRANLVLYLNCNPTFKYCLGGFSNDIDGVYTEVCRLAEKDARKKIEQIKIEHAKKIRQLEANRQAEIRSMFSENEISEFQKRNDDILRRMDAKGDIEDMPLNKSIQANLTEEEKQELNMLFVKGDKTSDDVIRMNFLIRKSKK